MRHILRLTKRLAFTMVVLLGFTSATSWARSHFADPINTDGDTELGVALKAGDHEAAIERLRKSTGDVAHTNRAGESYVYLAARAGFADVIRMLADRRYTTLPTVSFFHFEDMDPPNQNGENAFFVAANAAVLNELITQYRRGSKWYAGSYVRQLNAQDQTFLHAAALDGRREPAVWATQYLCQPSSWTDSGWSTIRMGSRALSRAGDLVQTYTFLGRIPVEGAMLFNNQDQEGATALHLAVAKQNWSTARALASCPWIDHDREDGAGNRPLQALLLHLDPDQMYDDEAHAFFHFLLQQKTRMRRWLISPVDRANHKNRVGQTAVQMAAGLKDPYFYRILTQYGDTEMVDQDGHAASDLRTARDQ